MDNLKHFFKNWDYFSTRYEIGELDEIGSYYYKMILDALTITNRYDVLKEHYINHKTYEQISFEMGYEKRNIYRIRLKEMKELAAIVFSEYSMNSAPTPPAI